MIDGIHVMTAFVMLYEAAIVGSRIMAESCPAATRARRMPATTKKRFQHAMDAIDDLI